MNKYLIRRKWLDTVIDKLRFTIDTFPGMDYQPLPWLGLRTARRSDGVQSRWDAIHAILCQLTVRTAVDVGCNAGFFSIKLAQDGIIVVGIESEPRYSRTCLYTARKLGLEHLTVLPWKVTPVTVSMVPPADCVLFLSVWHHMVKQHGFDNATAILRQLWAKTTVVLFFETGENEMPASFHLPAMVPNPAHYLTAYLRGTCSGSEVTHLGRHAAFDPEGRTARRNLFALVRRTPVTASLDESLRLT